MFSVVIPLYNKQDCIRNTVQSVLNQTFPDFEINIVDDGSTDRSLESARQFDDPRIRVFSKPNGGVSSARNYGIRQSRKKYIAFLDADDLWYPDYLSERILQTQKSILQCFVCCNPGGSFRESWLFSRESAYRRRLVYVDGHRRTL